GLPIAATYASTRGSKANLVGFLQGLRKLRPLSPEMLAFRVAVVNLIQWRRDEEVWEPNRGKARRTPVCRGLLRRRARCREKFPVLCRVRSIGEVGQSSTLGPIRATDEKSTDPTLLRAGRSVSRNRTK